MVFTAMYTWIGLFLSSYHCKGGQPSGENCWQLWYSELSHDLKCSDLRTFIWDGVYSRSEFRLWCPGIHLFQWSVLSSELRFHDSWKCLSSIFSNCIFFPILGFSRYFQDVCRSTVLLSWNCLKLFSQWKRWISGYSFGGWSVYAYTIII